MRTSPLWFFNVFVCTLIVLVIVRGAVSLHAPSENNRNITIRSAYYMSFDVLCQWGVWDVDSFENPRNRVPLQGHSYPATLLPILENAAVPSKFLESKVRLSLNTNRGKFLVDRSGNVRTPTGEYRLDSEDFALLQSLTVEMNKEFPTAEVRDDTEAESDQAIHRYPPGGTGTPFAFAVQHGCQTDLPGDR